MIENYHTHTPRCMHASGDEEEYIKRAVKCGLKTLGFSDHTPYVFGNGFVSHARMTPEQMPDYFDTLLRLREKYKDKIDIKIGFEAEYYPKLFDRLIEEYRKYPLEYIILGQHFVGNESEPDAVNIFNPTSDRGLMKRFTDQCIEALETSRFTYLAHPDCLNFIPLSKEDEEFRNSEYERLILSAMRTETPIEINLCGARYGRNYPNPSFWRIAGMLGAKTVIGCDAHSPSQIAVESELRFAEDFVKEHSLNLIEDFPLKNPCV